MSEVKSVPFGHIHTMFAQKKGVDTTKAGKLNRSFIRSNFDVIAKAWPELAKSGKNNKDGNRYPSHMPITVANAIVARDLAKLAKPRKARAPKVTTVTADVTEAPAV